VVVFSVLLGNGLPRDFGGFDLLMTPAVTAGVAMYGIVLIGVTGITALSRPIFFIHSPRVQKNPNSRASARAVSVFQSAKLTIASAMNPRPAVLLSASLCLGRLRLIPIGLLNRLLKAFLTGSTHC